MNEHEINARVAFKLSQIKDSITQQVGLSNIGKYHHALSGSYAESVRTEEYGKAMAFLLETFRKETDMPVPYDDMHNRKMQDIRDKAVQEIMKSFDIRGHEYRHKVSVVAQVIEQALYSLLKQ